MHSNALHQCDIINTTGVTENSDTISLCFFLLLRVSNYLSRAEPGHTPFVKSNDAEEPEGDFHGGWVEF